MTGESTNLLPAPETFPLSLMAKRSADQFGSRTVMRNWNGSAYREFTYSALNEAVDRIANWLILQGFKRGDRAATLGENRAEWCAAYLGILRAGGVVVPVDSLMPSTGIRHVLVDSEALYLFATRKYLRDLSEVAEIATLRQKVELDDMPGSQTGGSDRPTNGDDWIKMSTFRTTSDEPAGGFPVVAIDDLAALLYTSGTTGHSKGVMLSHRNISSNVAAASRFIHVGPTDVFLSVLPIHHAFECTAGFMLAVFSGSSITYARSMKSTDLIADIKGSKVSLMVAVPLLYEKLHAGIERNIKKKGALSRMLFWMLYGTSLLGEKVGFDLGVNLFASVREKAGFGTVRLFVSGGGPLDPQTADFFNRFGIRMLQGYGLTEASPITHVNPPWKARAITVGPPIPGVEQKIFEPNEAGVGEVWVRGPNIFLGYYKNPESTQEAKSPDGWLKTGDLGIIHSDGYLQIVGRKKNIIVTGGGKNVYPEEIEYYLNRQRFIAESLVMGISRDSGYGEEVGALIFPDYEQIDLFFEENGKPGRGTPDEVYAMLKGEIEAAQVELADYKRVRRFRIMEEEFQKTSTRKIKRFLYKGSMVGLGK